jgi:hypothetical protein
VIGSFSVGALAVQSSDANAIGAVRLTLLAERLEIELLKVGSFKDSFVPGALTERVRYLAPYTAIRGLVRRGETLVLTLDPKSPTPFTRFALTHFTDLPLEALALAHKRRAWALLLRTWLPVPAGIAAALAVPEGLANGTLGRAAVGLLASLATFVLLGAWVRVRSWGGPFSERLRDALERRVAEHLAIAPPIETPAHEAPSQEVVRATNPSPLGRLAGLRPILGTALAAIVATLLAVGSVAIYRGIERSAPTPAATNEDQPAASDSAVELTTRPPAPAPCKCARPDSPLWATDLPALTMILIPKQHDENGRPASNIAPVLNKKGSGRYDFEVAIVNNAAVPLRDIRIVLTFARRNKKGERTNATDRGLFWAGDLGPADSVKWNVQAPGTELRIDLDEKRTLGDKPGQLKPAPADAFVKLLAAKPPSIRLHGALMLAYLHDPRAHEAAENLSDLSDSDDHVRDMIARATTPLYACDAAYNKDGTLSACAVNDGEAPVMDALVREVGPDGRRFPVPIPLPPHAGVAIQIDGFGTPAEELMIRTP